MMAHGQIVILVGTLRPGPPDGPAAIFDHARAALAVAGVATPPAAPGRLPLGVVAGRRH